MTASENTLLFRDMLKSIEPGMAEILRTNQRYGKDVRALYKEFTSYFEEAMDAFPDNISIEFKNNNGCFYQNIASIDESWKWTYSDFGSEDMNEEEEEMYLKQIPDSRLIVRNNICTVTLQMSLDLNNMRWFLTHLDFQADGMCATFIISFDCVVDDHWDFGSLLQTRNPTKMFMGVTPGSCISNASAADVHWQFLKDVFGLSDDFQTYTKEHVIPAF